MILRPRLVLAAMLAAMPLLAVPIPAIWDAQYASGTVLGSDDDATFAATFPFTFSYAGQEYTSALISTNGFINLGNDDPNAYCCSGNAYGFLADGPRLAAAWTDLVTTVYQHNMDGVTTFTWEGSLFDSNSVLFQAQLYENGRIVFGYSSFSVDEFWGNDILIGVSAGRVPSDPGETDLLASTPIFFNGQYTVYQLFHAAGSETMTPQSSVTTPVNVPFSLDGANIVFEPAATGVPEPGSIVLSVAGLVAIGFYRRRK